MTTARALAILSDPKNQTCPGETGQRSDARRASRGAAPRSAARSYTPGAAAGVVAFLTIVLDIAETAPSDAVAAPLLPPDPSA